MTQPYQTVLFLDLDGTLMVNPFESAVWPVVMGEIAAKSGQSLEAVRKLILDEYRSRQADEAVLPVRSMDWDDMAELTAHRLGITLEANTEALVRQHALSHSSTLDNAHNILRELSAPHRALVVATKGLAKYQQPVLDALELTPLFTAIMTPDTHNGLKKHKRFFGDWPEQTRLQIMVGDMYDDDVLYPSGHGFKTVWKHVDAPAELREFGPFERAAHYPYKPEQTAHADALIFSLHELPDVVKRFEADLLS